MQTSTNDPAPGRIRVERGIYRQHNGKYAVCFMVDGKPRFRTVGHDLAATKGLHRRLPGRLARLIPSLTTCTAYTVVAYSLL
jgi:hypothetical protein